MEIAPEVDMITVLVVLIEGNRKVQRLRDY
jgi:hypothetical protein